MLEKEREMKKEKELMIGSLEDSIPGEDVKGTEDKKERQECP